MKWGKAANETDHIVAGIAERKAGRVGVDHGHVGKGEVTVGLLRHTDREVHPGHEPGRPDPPSQHIEQHAGPAPQVENRHPFGNGHTPDQAEQTFQVLGGVLEVPLGGEIVEKCLVRIVHS